MRKRVFVVGIVLIFDKISVLLCSVTIAQRFLFWLSVSRLPNVSLVFVFMPLTACFMFYQGLGC